VSFFVCFFFVGRLKFQPVAIALFARLPQHIHSIASLHNIFVFKKFNYYHYDNFCYKKEFRIGIGFTFLFRPFHDSMFTSFLLFISPQSRNHDCYNNCFYFPRVTFRNNFVDICSEKYGGWSFVQPTLPSEIGGLTSLTRLKLARDYSTRPQNDYGHIVVPTTLSQLSNLNSIVMWGAWLGGDMSFLAGFEKLTEVDLDANSFTNVQNLSNSSNLRDFTMRYNNMVGSPNLCKWLWCL
jgi:hypothetical protein